MRYALISDIHSNLEALNVVLKEIEAEKVDRILCLGDLVGYGPEPNECIEKVRGITDLVLAGNHDYAPVGKVNVFSFNYYARMAIEWTAQELAETFVDYLSNLPLKETVEDFVVVHATPKNPADWDYIMTLEDAIENFNYFQNQICFVGHSHIPLILIQMNGRCWVNRVAEVNIEKNKRYIINIGSVGQPRDSNPKSCYGIFDTEKMIFQLKRIPYNVKITQEKMRRAGLPEYLIDRLAYGR